MITASELRIGNWVNDAGMNALRITEIKDQLPLYYPIKLSGEMLDRYGFLHNQLEIGGEGDMWITCHDDYYFTIYNRGGEAKMPYEVAYLHQLQNAKITALLNCNNVSFGYFGVL